MAEGAAADMASVGEKKAGGTSAAPVSFSFTRTTGKRRLLAVTGPDGEDEKQETDFLRAVEGRELQRLRPALQPKELVIPLTQKSPWKEPGNPAPLQDPDGSNGVEAQAVRELLEESKRSQERWQSGRKIDPAFAIPLLMQNRLPGGYEEERDKMDASLHSESTAEADYEKVPVEAYGIAMLKGMGWKAGEGIGRTHKQDVKPLEVRLRPKGLGLGADRSAVQDLQPSRPQRPLKPGEEPSKSKDEPLGLVMGGAVFIEAGPHKELYGKIEGTDADNSRVMVKLAIGGKIVTVSQHRVRPVTQKEYDKFATDLSRLSKARKEKEAEQRNGAQHDSESRAASDRKEEKSKKRKHPPEAERDECLGQPSKMGVSTHSSSEGPHWLRRDLRVRFVDKLYKKGKYYNTKMVIEDVLKPDTCVCRTEEGRILDGIQESMLETVIPRGDSDWVMVVLGEHAGQVGRILRRNKEQSCVLVQLQRNEERLQTLDYDAVCHYVGRSEDD